MTRCTICGRTTRRTVRSGLAFDECETCGFGALADARSAADYWGENEAPPTDDGFWIDAKRRYFDSALELLERTARGRRVLDVGGGIGYFAERALARGWDAHSLDVSPKATERAAERLGRDRAWSSFQCVEAGSFDAVTLWCVVAHTREPGELVRCARMALRPDGVLWLTTPNFAFQKPYSALCARAGRRIDFAAHDHVVHFSPRALSDLLETCGFRGVEHHFRGITEACVAARSDSTLLVRGKRAWNRVACIAARAGLPNYMSELQVTARAS